MAQATTEAISPPLPIISSSDYNLMERSVILLYSRLGTPHCLKCGSAIEPQSTWEIAARLATLPPGTSFQLLSPVTKGRKVELAIASLQALAEDEREEFMAHLITTVSAALRKGSGVVMVRVGDEDRQGRFIRASDHKVCVVCGTNFPELGPGAFSSNSLASICRLNAAARSVTLGGKSITEVRRMPPGAALAWADSLYETLSEEALEVAGDALDEVRRQLQWISKPAHAA